MPISFAQNLEDIRLSRAFEGQEAGFYIDVGACHPIYHSVTRYFFLRGWRGVNIEPQGDMIELLRLDREGEINLQLGLSDVEGSLPFFEAPDSVGVSTFNDDWRAAWIERDGRKFFEQSTPVSTLARICERYVDRPIDFLKIDAEGHEDRVMAGGDFARWRPRVLLIEGDAGPWEPGFLASGYRFATFDGLNRFYVREEDEHLIPRLAEPVIGEEIVVHHQFRAMLSLEAELAAERAGHDATRRTLEDARREAGEVRARLAQTDGLGPSAIRLARRGQRLARRLPRLAGLVRRAIGG